MGQIRRVAGPLVVALVLLVVAVPAFAGPAFQSTAATGAVIALQGTPHLWIADDQGTLHWGGDTRALAGRFVNWGDRREVTLDQLKSFRRSDPWLSAGLLKIGDPIYLVKWESNQDRPTLLHIQSILDVQLFGIDATNYGNFVLDRTTWEQRFGINVDTLAKGELQSAVLPTATPTAAASATATPPALIVKQHAVGWIENNTRIETQIEVLGAPPGSRLTVSATLDEWNCTGTPDSNNCQSTRSDRWGPKDAGPADSTGRLLFIDQHGPYKTYTYTFTDVKGNSSSITFGNDLDLPRS